MHYIINTPHFNVGTRFNFGKIILNISLCKWKYDATSPVIFMIDDLANIYFERPGQFNVGDWGGCRDIDGSLYHFLNTEILSRFSKVKFTFFLVTGVREIQSVGTYDYVNSCDHPKFLSFLRQLEKEGHEIAYHGMEHGVLDADNEFIQEWTAFPTLASALEKVREGMGLVQSAGIKISGGKYCGYEGGSYGHQSIAQTGFRWWFDTWDANILQRPDGEFKDDVFYMPSNIDCSVYAPHLFGYLGKKKFYRSVIRQFKDGFTSQRIDKLLENKAIISLQEHSSPVRTDGKTQYPNVFDDLKSIRYILKKLDKHDVWWATASDVANYSRNREYLTITRGSDDSFSFESKEWRKCVTGVSVTLSVPRNVKSIETSHGTSQVYVNRGHYLSDVPVYQNCIYKLVLMDD